MTRRLRVPMALAAASVLVLSFQNCSQPVSVAEIASTVDASVTGPANGGGATGPSFVGDGSSSTGGSTPGGYIVGDGTTGTTTDGGSSSGGSTYDGGLISGGGQIVCDPFSASSGGSPGLKAKIVYYEGADASSKIKKVADIFNVGKLLENTDIYFSQVHVPTRSFSDGFDTTAGKKLLTPSGQVLTEWFGLRFESNLQLAAADEDGFYQLSTISDDGSVLEANFGSGYSILVDNDGITSTRMRCGAIVSLKKGQLLPMRLWYVQGPRTEIAVSLLWRKVASASPSQPSYCGTTSLNFFNSSGQLSSAAMRNDGWKVLSPSNFKLTGDVSSVCVPK